MISPLFLHDDFSMCEGCPECCPEAPASAVEVLPDFAPSEAFAQALHSAVISAVPASYLGRLASEADAAGLSLEELASKKTARAVKRLRRFFRQMRRAAEARGLTSEELLVRMVLTGSMGREVLA